ncbi:MAG: 4Fe-4S binding protein [Candidatus Hydrogenedentes bacterium]|nr:4Fe-4S binding protein [Candidatus Hydrogenedentota bacterium]
MPLVTTIREHCRVCFTCVRECPAKAIRIMEGQAMVLSDRCIGCGNCVRVCSQKAKQVYSSIEKVAALLDSGVPVAALVAPSFPAEFAECSHEQVVGMLRALGFSKVCEVAFGADLVADRYRRLLQSDGGKRYIGTTCPAIVAYIERYAPDLVECLAPIVSPMVAAAKVVRQRYGNDVRTVFIGPCIAKKGECVSGDVDDDVDAALTFVELRHMLRDQSVFPATVKPGEFDPPRPRAGALFPLHRGLLQAADLPENLLDTDVVAADGGNEFVDAVKEFQSGDMQVRLLEVLACKGCIMGPGMSGDSAMFRRRGLVSDYARERVEHMGLGDWYENMRTYETLDLSRTFSSHDRRIPAPSEEEMRRILGRMGKRVAADELNCGACGYPTCREHAAAIFTGLAESEMCLPYAIEQLRTTVKDLAVSHEQLAKTQAALRQSEKLATMGQLAAGIAHEINNPLGVVLMYAHILREERTSDSDLMGDLSLIVEQADRCKKIVAGLLHFARQNEVQLQPTDVAEHVGKCLAVMPPPEGVTTEISREGSPAVAEIDRDQMMQVWTNLITNAYAAMPRGGRLSVCVTGLIDSVSVRIGDTGVGISKANLAKIFEPFFTTKEIGKGTGLGLAVTYGIVKMHRGDIHVDTNEDPNEGPTGTAFTVTLPRRSEAGNTGARPGAALVESTL